jgi:hypothetical protein
MDFWQSFGVDGICIWTICIENICGCLLLYIVVRSLLVEKDIVGETLRSTLPLVSRFVFPSYLTKVYHDSLPVGYMETLPLVFVASMPVPLH